MRRIPLIASILLLGATCATALAAPGDLTYLYGRPDVNGNSDLYSPRGVSEAADGSILIADSYNHRVLRVTRAGAATTVAGIRNDPGFSGDGGPATQARLRYPVGVAALPDGGFLIADSENNRIRHVSPGGVIRTVAGGGYNGDGCDARRASFWWPYSVTAAPGGGFMVVDRSLDQVRRVWPDGSITTVAGHGGGPDDVDGIAAVDAGLNATDTSFTPDGGFLLTDEIYNRIRKVTLDGTITTVAGNGDRGAGVSGDGGPATAAEIDSPHAVAATSGGGFLIAQENGSRIREVSPAGTITTLARWLSYPLDVALLSGGGGAVAETGSDAVMLMESDLRPAVAPPTAFQGTGGYTGACLGLDPSFGGGTVRSKTLTDRAARGVVLQPGGKVVVAGQLDDPRRYQLALERYLPNGELDRSFGTDGLALPGGHMMTGFALGAQPGGKLIAVGGVAVNGVAVVAAARFTPDGQLDTSFGEGGIARAPALDHATAVDFAADGSIVIAGSKVWDPRLARITRDGAVDQSFGSGGFAPGPWEVTAIEALPDGRVVTASGPQLGHTGPPETMTVTRYRRDGSMDTTFAGSGRVNLAPVDTRRLDATALARHPDGRLLVVGQYDRDRGQDNDFPIIAMRLLEDGSIDRSFGDAGVVTVIPLHYRWSGGMYPIGATDANSIAIQPDGKIVMAGGDWAGGGFAIYRLHPDGALDPSFGAGGRIVTWLEGGSSANAVDLHPDGRIVAVGQVRFDVLAATYEAARRPGAPPTQTGNTTPTGAPLGGPAVGPAPVAASGGPAPAGAKAPSAATSILPRLSIASWSRARVRALLRGTWKVTVETPDAGQVLAELLVRGRKVAMGTAEVRKPGRTSIRLRRNERARRLLDGRRRVRATLTVRFRSADSTSATKRSVRFSR